MENLRELRKFCSLDHIVMLRACYLVAKRDPSILVGDIAMLTTTTTLSAEESAAAAAFQTARTQSTMKTNHFMFSEALPTDLLAEYKVGRNRNKQRVQKRLFDHITNYVSRSHTNDHEDVENNLLPASHLDLAISR